LGGRGPGREFFARALDFLEQFAVRYHVVKEETLVFPRLDRPGVDVREFRREHEEVRRRLRCLAEALGGERAGGAEVGGRALMEEASALVGVLRTHIQKENKSVLPVLEGSLSEEEDAGLARCLEEFEDAVLGPNAGERYHRIAHELVDLSGQHHD
jgi:hemerythrin-like domain-containing protein